jgi:hypothetical protein
LLPLVFETSASTNSAIRAKERTLHPAIRASIVLQVLRSAKILNFLIFYLVSFVFYLFNLSCGQPSL